MGLGSGQACLLLALRSQVSSFIPASVCCERCERRVALPGSAGLIKRQALLSFSKLPSSAPSEVGPLASHFTDTETDFREAEQLAPGGHILVTSEPTHSRPCAVTLSPRLERVPAGLSPVAPA